MESFLWRIETKSDVETHDLALYSPPAWPGTS